MNQAGYRYKTNSPYICLSSLCVIVLAHRGKIWLIAHLVSRSLTSTALFSTGNEAAEVVGWDSGSDSCCNTRQALRQEAKGELSSLAATCCCVFALHSLHLSVGTWPEAGVALSAAWKEVRDTSQPLQRHSARQFHRDTLAAGCLARSCSFADRGTAAGCNHPHHHTSSLKSTTICTPSSQRPGPCPGCLQHQPGCSEAAAQYLGAAALTPAQSG